MSGEERSFYWRLSGRGNLQFFATLYNMSSSQAERRINEILGTLELQDKADDLFHTYSTGIKQKLALARGLLNNPQILFIDEPTKSLDPIAAQNIRKLIREGQMLSLFSVVLLPLSIYAFKVGVRKAKKDGSLTHY